MALKIVSGDLRSRLRKSELVGVIYPACQPCKAEGVIVPNPHGEKTCPRCHGDFPPGREAVHEVAYGNVFKNAAHRIGRWLGLC